MAAYVIVKITLPTETVTQANGVVKSEAHNGLQALETLITKINCGNKSAQVDVYVSGTDETITAQNGGLSASYSKL